MTTAMCIAARSCATAAAGVTPRAKAVFDRRVGTLGPSPRSRPRRPTRKASVESGSRASREGGQAGRNLIVAPHLAVSPRGDGGGSTVLSDTPIVPETDRVAFLWPAVAASSIFMCVWVFGPFPGSMFTGVPEHDEFIRSVYEFLHFDVVFGPTSLLLKYNEAGRLPALMHALPGAVWCALSTLQLHPQSRTAFGGELHRTGGRAMLTAAAVLMLGYAVIDANGLYADMHDFGGHGGGVSEAIDAKVASATAEGKLPALPPFNLVGVRGIAAGFIATGVMTGVTAKRGNYKAHRAWALRHVASGLWVAAQRPLYSVFRMVGVGAGLLGLYDAESSAAFADSFYYASYVTTFVYFMAAEWAIRENDDKSPQDVDGETSV